MSVACEVDHLSLNLITLNNVCAIWNIVPFKNVNASSYIAGTDILTVNVIHLVQPCGTNAHSLTFTII